MANIEDVNINISGLEEWAYNLPPPSSFYPSGYWISRDDVRNLNEIVMFQLRWAQTKIQYLTTVYESIDSQLNAIEAGILSL